MRFGPELTLHVNVCVVSCQHGKACDTEVPSEDGQDEEVQSEQFEALQEVGMLPLWLSPKRKQCYPG